MLATGARIFLNEQMFWTLQATCTVCGRETLAPLVMNAPICCVGCGALVKIDVAETIFRREEAASRPARGSWFNPASAG